ncbi:MAG TPA: alkaline phosphatase family protein [Candidatus Cybelea sp.]|nr:alkaline phosphatase family protein [Candidatus Cybelea sp.]
MKERSYLIASLLGVALALSACGSASNAVPSQNPLQTAARHRNSSYPITHIVLVIQENRSFNNLFATFPGAVGSTTGLELVGKGKKEKQVSINLTESDLAPTKNLNHYYSAYKTAYDNGNMDAFNRIKYATTGKEEGALPYAYVNPYQVQPYWTLATDYALADHLFSTQGSSSFTAHQDLIRGGTEINSTESLIDDPTSAAAWGCTSSPGTKTSLITTSLVYESKKGPYPCTSKFPSSGSTYETLADLFDAANLSWKYYTPAPKNYTTGSFWNAFLVIDSVYGNKKEWNKHIAVPQTKIFTDISKGKLPAMSWVIPDALDSDHPGYKSDTGPSWVASIVNAIGQSSYWNSTAVIVVWDDWGGFYDPVEPPALDNQGGPGFRVGMIVASPYVPPNEISHTVYGFGSIIKFIENTWSLGSLGTTDQSSTSIGNMFDFTQKPRTFKKIPAKYSRWFFLHQKPSNLPVDTE